MKKWKDAIEVCYQASLHMITDEENEPRIVKEALSVPNKGCPWKEAMDKEIASLMKNGTWEIVPTPNNRDIVSCKWVFILKRNTDGKIDRYKARFVARGFSQKYGTDYDGVVAQTT